MHLRLQLQGAGTVVALFLAALSGTAAAHVVPSMTVEAAFSRDRTCTLIINVDPRTFLAAEPTTLPPVPAAWYREQTPEQLTATHVRAQEFLSRSLGVLFDGKRAELPSCRIEPINGEDNTPLTDETKEVHLLASAELSVPDAAAGFQIDFDKSANTSLILVHTQDGKDLRPQVLFPGETSRSFSLQPAPPAGPPAIQPPPGTPASRVFLVIAISAAVILLLTSWRLLAYYRHHHRLHARPKSNDVNN